MSIQRRSYRFYGVFHQVAGLKSSLRVKSSFSPVLSPIPPLPPPPATLLLLLLLPMNYFKIIYSRYWLLLHKNSIDFFFFFALIFQIQRWTSSDVLMSRGDRTLITYSDPVTSPCFCKISMTFLKMLRHYLCFSWIRKVLCWSLSRTVTQSS